jgi:hypothetical protein
MACAGSLGEATTEDAECRPFDCTVRKSANCFAQDDTFGGQEEAAKKAKKKG